MEQSRKTAARIILYKVIDFGCHCQKVLAYLTKPFINGDT